MIVDIVIISILLISALVSFLRGFIKELCTIAGLTGGLIASYYFGDDSATMLRDAFGVNGESGKLGGLVPYTLLVDLLAYALLFIVIVGIVSFIASRLAAGAKTLGLGPADRFLGVIFGLVRGALLVTLFYLPFHYILGDKEKATWLKDSKTIGYVQESAKWVIALIPEDVKGNVEERKKDAQKKLDSVKEKAGDAAKDVIIDQVTPPKPAASPSDSSPSGYQEEQRNDMENLIESYDSPDANGTTTPDETKTPDGEKNGQPETNQTGQ